ncbi:tRNA (adenosine(37)-N6)-threonylcarbamoyltransferase complex ATPase subunit type 1 TsaE [Candidatus Saccharibacteria bacterium]|nr:tRNA (adenosine(37)-N6)-threonylcarbamoyltransferase complex ATPase subunit type 1 TsaE [Candidatus Saccharibacteria bacterium]
MQVVLHSDKETNAFGVKLGSILTGGEVIELVGDIGAGKTTLTKGIARGMGIAETVQSPTFTISNLYTTKDGGSLKHYDFYRLSDPGIMAEELQEAVADETARIVIEWGEIVRDILPMDHVRIVLTPIDDTTRQLDISANGEKSSSVLKRLAQ